MPGSVSRPVRARKHSADSVFVLILICAFAICALFIILFGARVYSGVRARSEGNDTVRSGLMYLRSKVRANDRAGGVQYTGDVLLLTSEPFWGIFEQKTYIFYREGGLHEYGALHVVGDDLLDVNQVVSQFIMPASGFRVEEHDGLLTLTIYDPDGTPYSTAMSVRSGIGGTP